MADPRQHMPRTDEELALSYVMEELSISEREAFEQDLANSRTLQRGVEEARAWVEGLRDVPQEEVTRDITPDVMAAVHAVDESPATPYLTHALKIAAALIILLGAALLTERLSRDTTTLATAGQEQEFEQAVSQGRDWLATAQEPSGAWEAGKWGGQDEHTIGLTALALLALLDEGYDHGPYAAHIERGVTYLLEGQDERGCFDSLSLNESYNHGMAVVALLGVYEQRPTPSLRRALSPALAYLQHSQDRSSGWAYDVRENDKPLPAQSVWTVAALQRARALGWDHLDRAADEGSAWLDDRRRKLSAFTADMAATDALYLIGDAYEAAMPGHTALVRDELIASQIKAGELAGSWNAARGWRKAGGRVYATALSTLTLRAETTTM